MAPHIAALPVIVPFIAAAGLVVVRLFDRRWLNDAFGLRYLKGGGVGCNYPDERFSQSRRQFHHLVFYGFLLDLASSPTDERFPY